MEKKTWNQNLMDKYDNIIRQLYVVIGNILREKLGEDVTINYDGGEVITGKLEYVGSTYFAISFGKDNDALKYLYFEYMHSFPFSEGNNIDMIAEKDEW